MQIAGRYTIEKELARGASGCVYLATDQTAGRPVALKVLTPGEDAALLSRNEFSKLLGLKHPHVVEILDIGEDAETGSPFLAMEYVEGIPLSEALAAADEARALDYLIQAARALGYIHSRQLLHRDLKPANLIVRSDGVLKIVDFGLAADLRATSPGAAGTLVYMAPEAIEGRPVDGRSDLYSLGLSFYHAFTGTPPFSAEKRAELIEQVLEGRFPPPEGPELPRILGPALMRLGARKPEERFATAADLIRHVDLAVGGGLGLETAETERSYLTAPQMVGRARESARLAEALASISNLDATPETPPLFLLGGEAGIGKSRFLMEFRKQAVLGGVSTIQVQCPEIASAPLQPFSLVLRALTPPAADAKSPRSRAHKRLAALLGGEAAGGADDEEAPERRIAREKSRLLDGFTGYLLDQASAAPLVIILEDLHWADGPSLDLVSYLSRNAAGSRLLLVASHRGENEVSEEFSSWLATVTRREWCERHSLERLGEDDVLQMLGTVFGAAPIDAEVVRALARESGGNPLFLLEILRSLQSENALARTASGWRLPELEGVRAAIPQDLDRALARRLGRVEGTESIMLGAIAVLARPAGPEIAAELAGVPVPEAAAALDRLVGKGLLARTAWAGGRYVFEHALVRRAAEEHLDAPVARALHQKAGEILERDAPDVEGACEEIARHYTSGGPPERAALFSERAGDLALARHAGADAARHFEGALGLIPEADRERRAAVLFKAGNGRLAAGDLSRARAHFEALLEMAAEGGEAAEPGRRARVLERLGTVLGFQRSGEEGIAYVDEALVLFRQIGDLAGEARALHNLAIRHARQSRYAQALPQFHAALLVHERRGDVAAMADERNSLGLVECFLGRYEISAEHLESAFDLARSVDYRYLMGASRHNLGIVRRSQGRPEEALQSAREALAIFDEIGHRAAYGFAMLNVGLYSRAAGLLESALETFRAARSAVARAADASREVYALECEADLLRYLGQPLTAVDRLGEAVRVATRAADERQRGYATAALSRALLDAGRPTEGLEKAKAAFAIGEKTACPRLVARSLIAISAASLGVGEPAEAAARARELLARSAAEIPLEEMAAEGNLLLASALMALSDPGGAQDALGEAKRTIQARQLRSLAPLCARLEARLAQGAGSPEKARSLEKEAATLRRATAESIQDEALRRSFTTAVTFEWPKEEEAAGSPSGGTAQAALQALYEITGLVSAAHALDELLDRVLDLVLDVVGAARGLIILIDEAGALEVRTSRGVERETARDATQYSKSIVRAAEAGEAILSTDAEHDERFNRFRSISLFRIKSLMCVPLRVRGRIIGTVYVDGGGKGRIFTKPDLSFLEAFANQAAVAIENARMYVTLAQENQRLQRAAQTTYRFSNFIGRSSAMQKVFDLMERAAATPLPVLIQGESGTGKELVARALHFNSPRKARPFLSENCAAIPEALLESELFGYAQGAFTGANRDKKGLYEMADGGTLFLDEVGDMPFAIQAKFLRVLQEGEFRPVGGQEVRRASVRIVAATNADLAQRIADGRFREDLYYRLNVISILLPTLRSRKEDIPLLIEHFLAKAAKERKLTRMTVADELLSVLVRYNWPGNVRQLENALSRLAVMSSGSRITLKDLEADAQLFDQLVVFEPGPAAIEDLTTLEKRQILRALQETGGNRVQAAQLLGISRATIFRKIREFGIS